MSRVLALAVLAAVCFVGCTLVLSPDEEQCATNADCEARGLVGGVCNDENVCEEDPVWGCLGHVTDETADPSKKVEVTLQFVLAVDGSPAPTDLDIDVCDTLDLDCTGGNPDLPKDLHPDSEGYATATVPEGFAGFVRMTHPDLVDSRLFVGRPVFAQPPYNLVRLLQPSDIDLLSNFAKVPIDADRGVAILVALDCGGVRAGGVSFTCSTADDKTTEFYLRNNFPVQPPDATATDVDGFGGYANLPEGGVVAESIRAADGAFIGRSTFQIFPNTVSYVLIGPSPQ